MSPPRVLYTLGSLAANDLGDEIIAVLAHLSRTDFEPMVVALGGRGELKRRIEELNVRTHLLGLVGPWGTLRAVSKVRSLIRKSGIDVVHGFGSWGGAVAQNAAPPDVAVVRSVTRPPTHEKDLNGRALRRLEKRARGRVSTRFVVPNDESVGLAVRAYGATEGRVEVLPRSVDVEGIRDHVRRTPRDSARVLMGVASDDPALVLMTGFESGARMDELLTGFSLATTELPNLRLFVVGSGRYEGPTRWKAEELHLGDSVIFLGHGSDLGPIWAAADAAVDATPWSSWSRQALYAIATGLPTVKVQAGISGWSEDLDESQPMISGNPERFAADLVRLASDRELREQVAGKLEGVAEEVDVVSVVGRLSGLYESLLS